MSAPLKENNFARLWPRFQPWWIWGLVASFFFCDYFARVSTSVMTADLMHAFSLNAFGLGTLSSFFYYPYLLMQIPVGLLVDRFKLKPLLSIMCGLTVFSCAGFAMAQHLWQAEAARALLGFCAAFAFVSTIKVASEWFPASRLGLLAGLTQACGMLGAAVGDVPIGYLVRTVGWRDTMMVIACIFAVLAVLIASFVKNHPSAKSARQHAGRESIISSLKVVLSSRESWRIAAYAGLLYAPMAAFAELWGVPYLQHAMGLSAAKAQTANALLFIGWAFGGPIMGALSDTIGRRKPVCLVSAALGLVLFSLLLLMPHMRYFWVCSILFLYGFTNTGVAIAYALATEVHQPRYVGVSVAFVNMASVIIGALLQPIIGKLLDIFAGQHQHAHVFHFATGYFTEALWILPVSLVLALLVASQLSETYCRPRATRALP